MLTINTIAKQLKEYFFYKHGNNTISGHILVTEADTFDIGSAAKPLRAIYADSIIGTPVGNDELVGVEAGDTPGYLDDKITAGAHISKAITGTTDKALQLSVSTTALLLRDGTNSLTGNLAVSPGVTIDGVDLSVHVADPDAHHNQQHNIVGSDHTGTGDQHDVIGFASTNSLAVLNTTSNGSSNFNTILRSGPAGGLELTFLDLDDDITVPEINSPSHMNILPSGNLTIDTGGEVIFPQAQTINSDNFSPGIPIQGWGIFQYASGGVISTTRNGMQIYSLVVDELRARTFVVDEVRVDRGEEFVTKSYGTVARNFDTPLSVGGTVTIWFEDSPAFSGAIFSNGDYILFRIFQEDGGCFTIANIIFEVTGYTNQTGPYQTWTAELIEGLTDFEILAGSVGWDFGQEGQGYIHSSVVDTSGSPYIDIRTWEESIGGGVGPFEGDIQTHVRIGFLISSISATMNPTGWGLYSDNAFLEGVLHAAGGTVILDEDGARIIVPVGFDTFIEKYGYSYVDSDGNYAGGIEAVYGTLPWDHFTITLQSIGTDEHAPRTRVHSSAVEVSGTFANATTIISASNAAGESGQIEILATPSAGTITLTADDVIIDTDLNTEHVLPQTDATYDLGSASFRYREGYFSGSLHVDGGLVVGIIGGSEWEYEGNMSIDAKLGTDTTVSVLNTEAGNVTFHVAGNITTDGTIDGVDLANLAVSVAFSSTLMTAGDGLTGGGSLAANRTFAVDSTVVRTTRTIGSGAGLFGGGDLSTNLTLNIGQGDGITVNADDIAVDSTVVRTTRTLTAGDGLTGGGTLATDRTFTLGTPSTLTASTTNGVTTTSHTHVITASANPGASESILKSTGEGGLTLQNLTAQGNVDITSGGDLTVGANIFFVDASVGNVGINCAPDIQFDLDVLGNIRAQGWFVGKHALQIEGAAIICHFDGPLPATENETGHSEGHMGQVPNVTGNPIYRAGAFRGSKAIEIAEATTNLIANPDFAGPSTTGWTDITEGTATGSRAFSSARRKYTTFSYRLIKTGGASGENFGTSHAFNVTNGQTYTITAWINVLAISGGAQRVALRATGNVLGNTFITGTTNGWQRFSLTVTATGTGTAGLRVDIDSADTATIYIANVQAEQKAYPTPYTRTSRIANDISYPSAQMGTIWIDTFDDFSIGGWYWLDFSPTVTGSNMSLFDLAVNGSTRYLCFVNLATGNVRITNLTNSIDTSAALTAQGWHHVMVTVSGTTLALYVDGQEAGTTTVTTSLTGSPGIWVGSALSGGDRLNGLVDDFIVVTRAMPASEVLAVYESNAPVFAETATFTFRLPNNLVWGDSQGLWVRTDDGTAAFGISGVDGKSWGGYTLDKGDVVIGNTSGHSVRWDHSAGTMTFVGNGAEVTAISGNNITTGTINASVVSVTNINAGNITAGALSTDRIAAGSITADKLDVNVIDASGNISAGGGDVTIDDNGITVEVGATLVESGTYKLKDSSGNLVSLFGAWDTGGTTTTSLYASGGVSDNSTLLITSNTTGSDVPIISIYTAVDDIQEAWIDLGGAFTPFRVQIGLVASIFQSSTTLGLATLTLSQSDLSEPFIDFVSTIGASNPISTSALGTYYGKVRVSVNGTDKWMALYN